MSTRIVALEWLIAARIWVMPLAFSPVVVAWGAATSAHGVWAGDVIRVLLCMTIAVLLPAGAGLIAAGIHGRTQCGIGSGVASGSRASDHFVIAGAVCWALAVLMSLALAAVVRQWWVVPGVVAIGAAWFYSMRPSRDLFFGLGEVLVAGTLGVAATIGMSLVLLGGVNREAWYGAAQVGLSVLAFQVLAAKRDARPGVRSHPLDATRSRTGWRITFAVIVVAPFAVLGLLATDYTIMRYGYFALLAAIPACVIGVMARSERELSTASHLISVTALAVAVALGCGFAFSEGVSPS